MLLIEAWVTLIWIDLVILWRPYNKWRHWFVSKPKISMIDESQLLEVSHLIQVTEYAARNHIRPMNCLRRTLAQQWILARRKIICQVRIGVRMAEDRLEAHAWLTLRDKVLNDSADVSEYYTELKKDQWSEIGRFVD
jgi:hypothetical protein